MSDYRLDHGDPEAGPLYPFDNLAHRRAERSMSELVNESMDKAVADETRAFREQIIEAEAKYAAAMIRAADYHQARMKRQRLEALVMDALSFVAGGAIGYGLSKVWG